MSIIIFLATRLNWGDRLFAHPSVVARIKSDPDSFATCCYNNDGRFTVMGREIIERCDLPENKILCCADPLRRQYGSPLLYTDKRVLAIPEDIA